MISEHARRNYQVVSLKNDLSGFRFLERSPFEFAIPPRNNRFHAAAGISPA
jgi:hypothetical protein